jgi:UDP-N-acetylglucosamine/UDP-N-acetyl-alpha-D-glucosaminouronate 4-epimerase
MKPPQTLKVLVSGGAGFIGSHLVEALVARGHRVRVLDDFSSGRIDNLRAVSSDVEVQEGDCADAGAVRRAVQGIEVVCHQAAALSVARSIEEPSQSQRNGGVATLTLLDAARAAGVRRFLYAGSSSVYGDSVRLPKRESLEPRPLSPYAVEKLVGEHYLKMFAALYGMETLTLRYFNVFGPRQTLACPYSGIVHRLIASLLRGEAPAMGDASQARDFTYVANVVEANLLALRARDLSGQAVNVGTGRRTTLATLVGLLCDEMGRSRPAGAPRADGPRQIFTDLSLAQRLIGYRPIVDLETGLRRTLDWYRNLGERPAPVRAGRPLRGAHQPVPAVP